MSHRLARRKMKRFIKRVYMAIMQRITGFVIGVYNHTEAIIILVLASLGLNSLLGELPFYYMLPMWVEITMIIPMLAIIIITLLTKSAEFRALRRNAKLVSA